MDIYREILDAIRSGGRVATATVIASSGSTPVPPGAKMLLRAGDGIPVGTVGGGCVEADVIEASRELLAGDRNCVIRRFTLTEDDTESGMLCGGTIDILVESLTGGLDELYAKVLSRREAGEDSAVVTVLGPGENVSGKVLIAPEGGTIPVQDLADLRRRVHRLPDSFGETVLLAVEKQAVTRLPWAEGQIIVEPAVGLQDVFVFGGGHVSRYVSRCAVMAGFRVTVIDDRPDYANPRRFPEAYRTLAMLFEESWRELDIRPSASIVIVTRGHKFDEIVLERAITTPARYIGMIGSKRKVVSTFANLVRRGVSREKLQRVRAPIGLSIGAQTAEEIGVSIVAELIGSRRGASLPAAPMSDRVAAFFQGDIPGLS